MNAHRHLQTPTVAGCVGCRATRTGASMLEYATKSRRPSRRHLSRTEQPPLDGIENGCTTHARFAHANEFVDRVAYGACKLDQLLHCHPLGLSLQIPHLIENAVVKCFDRFVCRHTRFYHRTVRGSVDVDGQVEPQEKRLGIADLIREGTHAQSQLVSMWRREAAARNCPGTYSSKWHSEAGGSTSRPAPRSELSASWQLMTVFSSS